MTYVEKFRSIFTDIAGAIRNKNGSDETYTPEQMAQAISDIPEGGNDILRQLAEGTASGDVVVPGEKLGALTVYFNTEQGSYYPSNKAVTSLTFPDAVTIGNNNISECGIFVSYGGAQNLTSINMPKVTNLNFKTYNTVSEKFFPKLEEFNAPKLEVASVYLGGAQLSTLNIPNVSYISSSAFKKTKKLKSLRLDKLNQISYNAFYNCQNLETFDFALEASGTPDTIIYNNVFNSCLALDALILRKSDKIVVLNSTDALQETPIMNGTGYIYVPSNTLEAYKEATNWSTFADQFRALENYTDDGTISGNFIKPEE